VAPPTPRAAIRFPGAEYLKALAVNHLAAGFPAAHAEKLAVPRWSRAAKAGFSRVFSRGAPGTRSAFYRRGMLHSPQVSRVAARTATFALAVLIAIGGIPASAFAAMPCNTSNAHCQNQAVQENHCAQGTVVMSCACHSAEQPANSNSSRASDLVSAGVPHASPSWFVHARPTVSLSRPDYPLTQGRFLVPLPILHASLLI